ncbi:MAG: sporulation protein YunB [Clostridia bacterium]|nr:sporulation protein YunB [Clostridia bacterium]
MYYVKHRKENGFFKRRLLIALLAVVMVLVLFELQLRPMVSVIIENEARRLYTDAVNESVAEVMGESGIDYSDLVSMQLDSQGNVTSIQVDSAAVNMLSAKISARVAQKLDDGYLSNTQIDMGTLTGIRMLNGCGPDAALRLKLKGSVKIDIDEKFDEKGINQTLHSLECNVSAQVVTYIPGFSSVVTIETNVPLVNTVIVGEVPQSYTVVNGDQSDTVGRIFDYGDPYGNDVILD